MLSMIVMMICPVKTVTSRGMHTVTSRGIHMMKDNIRDSFLHV